MEKIEFETERLIVRPPIDKDASDIFKNYTQDKEVVKYLVWPIHQKIEDSIEFIRFCINEWGNGTYISFSIYSKAVSEVIGMLDFRFEYGKSDFGYVLARKYWNQGIMTEAMKPVLKYVWGIDSIYKIWAVHDVDNPSSGKVMEKIGLKYECTIKNCAHHPNISEKLRDCKLYSINK